MGGVAIIAHPFVGVFPKAFRDFMDAIKGKIDGIEIMNGNTPMPANFEAMRLAKKLGIPGTGGSDAHTIEDVGKAFTICEGDILEDIRKNKIKTGWL